MHHEETWVSLYLEERVAPSDSFVPVTANFMLEMQWLIEIVLAIPASLVWNLELKQTCGILYILCLCPVIWDFRIEFPACPKGRLKV